MGTMIHVIHTARGENTGREADRGRKLFSIKNAKTHGRKHFKVGQVPEKSKLMATMPILDTCQLAKVRSFTRGKITSHVILTKITF